MALLLLLCALPAVALADEACPNEQLRAEDNSTQLPECRAYELVSAPQKHGGAVSMTQLVMGAPSGESALYASTSVFAGAQGSSLANGYVASRTPSGWSTQPIEAPQLNEGQLLSYPTQGVSEDLRQTFQVSSMALAPGAVQGQGNIYMRDNATGERTLVATSSAPLAATEFGSILYTTMIGATPNFSHVVFGLPVALTPDSTQGGSNIYDWTGGALHLVNYLPDGTVATNASGPVSSSETGEDPHQVSVDGSKIFFEAGEALFVRENDTTTVPISVSQRAGAPTTPQPAYFGGASADGSEVYFISAANLTEGPETPGFSLYRYDLNTGLLTNLTVDTAPSDAGLGPQVIKTLQVSPDGAYVYFTAHGDLAPGATTVPAGTENVYVWHEGQGIKWIANARLGKPESEGLSINAQASPNGLHFAFVSTTQLTEYHCSGCGMIYEYEYETGQLRCVSCDPGGAPVTGAIEFGGLSFGIGIGNYHPRVVLDNGTVLFGSHDALVPRDTNGQEDVYAWQDGRLALLSNGTGDQEAVFADASPDGKNVFFRTGQQLVGRDGDENIDLYDARVGGGFPASVAPAPCSGTGCQGVPPAPPVFATPPSVTYDGVGNFEPQPKSVTKKKVVAPTRAQKLRAALSACRRDRAPRSKHKRAACETRARKRYAQAAGAQRSKSNAIKSNRRGK